MTLNPRKVFKAFFIGSPTSHSNHFTFVNSFGRIAEELSFKMTRHSSILPTTHEWDEEIHVKYSTSIWHNQDSNS